MNIAGRLLMIFLIAGVSCAAGQEAQAPPAQAIFQYQEVMVPVRDGMHLQTVILTPTNARKQLPILFRRTPYGVPEKAPQQMPASMKELAQDGYIFVVQNLRGRFKSEGDYKLSSQVDLKDPKATSEQASPVDQWMNDDFHRYGALRESYAFEYTVMEQSDKNSNTHFDFETYDSYEWYLALGPLTNINGKYLHGKIPVWNDTVEHADYDEYWKKEAWVLQLHDSPVPNLNVAGFWDQEDPWGPWQIFEHAGEHDPDHNNFMVAGPWFHGEWQSPKGESIGIIPFGGHETAREFREMIEAPFFRYYLHGVGEKPTWKANIFQSGSNTWHTYAAWPPKETKTTKLYFHADGSLSFTEPGKSANAKAFREYVSNPANPVPYRQRPISPTYPAGDWRTWEVADQRFVDHRPDVLSYVSAPLEHDLVITGPVSAELFASTTGTDGDFVVKLIDVYPESAQKNSWKPEEGPKPGQYAQSLNGYELPVANEPTKWEVPLRNHDHVFLKGHRIMVQVQSTWFPVIDRNPQKFVPSIYKAQADDFVPAAQRVYSTPGMESFVVLPVMP